MRKKICVIGNGVQVARDLADVGEDLHGADIVVLGTETDLEEIRDRAPAAAVLVVGGAERCQQVYDATLFPRGRVIGIEEEDLPTAIESILLERNDEHDVIALADGEFARRRVRLGLRGITEVL